MTKHSYEVVILWSSPGEFMRKVSLEQNSFVLVFFFLLHFFLRCIYTMHCRFSLAQNEVRRMGLPHI